MKKLLFGLALGVAAPLAIASAPIAAAQEFPTNPGAFWEVTGIHIEDGQGYNYVKWLASEWRKEMVFAKSKGWVTDYKVLSNVYNRDGEPDLYLVVMHNNVPDPTESIAQRKAYFEWQSKTVDKLEAESGGRVKMRTVGGTMLLQEMMFN